MSSRRSTAIRLPNLFLVGALRAGTTSVHRALSAHRDVYMSPVKEPNYFARHDGPSWMTGIAGRELERYLHGPMRDRHAARITTWEDYLVLFRGAGGESVVGEASPSYLYSEAAPAEIASRCPEACVVISLRDPVGRALSHHGMDVAIGRASSSFAEVVGDPVDRRNPYVDAGFYADRVERYLQTFGDRLHVIVFDELEADPQRTFAGLADFLEIDPSGLGSPAPANAGLSPRMPALNALLHASGVKRLVRRVLPQRAVRTGKRVFYRSAGARGELTSLREIFRGDVERLEELLGRDLSHWLESPEAALEREARS